jgi:hypothetical protein
MKMRTIETLIHRVENWQRIRYHELGRGLKDNLGTIISKNTNDASYKKMIKNSCLKSGSMINTQELLPKNA